MWPEICLAGKSRLESPRTVLLLSAGPERAGPAPWLEAATPTWTPAATRGTSSVSLWAPQPQLLFTPFSPSLSELGLTPCAVPLGPRRAGSRCRSPHLPHSCWTFTDQDKPQSVTSLSQFPRKLTVTRTGPRLRCPRESVPVVHGTPRECVALTACFVPCSHGSNIHVSPSGLLSRPRCSIQRRHRTGWRISQ